MLQIATIVIVLGALYLIARRIDVRLVLIVAGVVLASLVGTPTKILDAFQSALGKGDVIGPICTAMGYAFVLRITGCDKDLVRLLVQPMRRAAWALVPGGVAIGFLTNMAITSQTAAAAAVGPILVPLMIAAGYAPVAAAATLLIGCSIGGNLFNPGEPDIVAVNAATGVNVADIIAVASVPTLLACSVAVVVLLVLIHQRRLWNRAPLHEVQQSEADADSPNVLRGLLAPLPVILLLVLQPRFALVPVVQQIWPNGVAVSAIMVVCTGLVILATAGGMRSLARHASMVSVEFFSGMGYAFTNVISVIIAATCFLAGLEAVGAIRAVSSAIAANQGLSHVLSPLSTALLAIVSGSGTAPSLAFSQAVLPSIVEMGSTGVAVALGVAGAIGASIGRTTSPVSAVMHFTSSLTDVPVQDLVRFVWLPLAAALVSAMLYGLVFL